MGRKNPDLCARPHCRERRAWLVSAYEHRWRRTWTLRVCEDHAEPYREHGDPARVMTLTRRREQ